MACFSCKFRFKSFEPSGENSYLRGREQCHPRIFIVHMNSVHKIFGVKMCLVE